MHPAPNALPFGFPSVVAARVGYGSALAVVMFGLSMIVTIFYLKMMRAKE